MNVIKRNLILLLFSRSISLMGTGIQTIAIPLYILDLTGSATMMGLFTMISLLPAIISAPIAGIIGDKCNKKKVMVFSDIVMGGMASTMAVFVFLGHMNIAVLISCQIVISIFEIIFGTSSLSIIPEIFSSDSLKRVNGLRGSFNGVALILSSAIGCIIYAYCGILAIFIINAISFFVASFLEFLIIYEKKNAVKTGYSVKSVKDDMINALISIKGNIGVFHIFIFIIVINFFDAPFQNVGIPFLFKEIINFSPQQYGIIITSFSIGSLLGDLLIASYYAKRSTKTLMKKVLWLEYSIIILFCVISLPIFLSMFKNVQMVYFFLYILLLVPIGMLDSIMNILIMTNIQQSASKEYMSSFIAVMYMMVNGIAPIGALLLGVTLDLFPAHIVLISLSVIMLFVVMIFTKFGSEKAFNTELVPEEEVA